MARLAPALARDRAHAETVACPRPRCRAAVGATCVNERTGQLLTVQAAHDERLRLADRHAAHPHPCPRCEAPAGQPCAAVRGYPIDQHRPIHDDRLTVAGCYRPPVDMHDVNTGFPHRRSPEQQIARGLAEVERRRTQLQIRHRELRANQAAGDLTEAERAELLRLDADLAALDGDPDPEPAPGWARGPRPRGGAQA